LRPRQHFCCLNVRRLLSRDIHHWLYFSQTEIVDVHIINIQIIVFCLYSGCPSKMRNKQHVNYQPCSPNHSLIKTFNICNFLSWMLSLLVKLNYIVRILALLINYYLALLLPLIHPSPFLLLHSSLILRKLYNTTVAWHPMFFCNYHFTSQQDPTEWIITVHEITCCTLYNKYKTTVGRYFTKPYNSK